MKLIIFAGGVGSRLWPLSRENSPKQFDRIHGGRSTLELAVSRIKKDFGIDNIFIQTIGKYRKTVKEQIPDIKEENIIIEPERRNLAPAVCLAVNELDKRGIKGSMALLWADHLMGRPEEFVKALKAGEELISKDPERFIFLGEKPRFANNNLGWINIGEKIDEVRDLSYYSFRGWKYKPGAGECREMFKSGQYFWNPGYFITSVKFLLGQYVKSAPDILAVVKSNEYEKAEAIHFDRAIIEKVDLNKAVVIKTNMRWSDPGTLYALKEALESRKEGNVIKGNVSFLNLKDCLIYNKEDSKIMAAVGLNGIVAINTPDALVIASKDEVVNITELLKKMKAEGKEKYL